LKAFLVIADGHVIAPPRHYRKAQAALRACLALRRCDMPCRARSSRGKKRGPNYTRPLS
jgi:hypothetical protein